MIKQFSPIDYLDRCRDWFLGVPREIRQRNRFVSHDLDERDVSFGQLHKRGFETGVSFGLDEKAIAAQFLQDLDAVIVQMRAIGGMDDAERLIFLLLRAEEPQLRG